MEKVVFTTGGTGGHIYPALSIAKKVREKSIDTLFIGTKHRMEKDIVPNENFRFIGLDVLPLRSVKSVIKMITATISAIKLLKKEKHHVTRIHTQPRPFGVLPRSCATQPA